MTVECVLAGFGGQGVMTAGKTLAYMAMRRGYNVTYIPSYGAEVRGGTANCTVVVSDEPIASPICDSPSCALVMNGPSFERFEPRVAPGGLLIVNSTLVAQRPRREDLRSVYVDATSIARGLGDARAANMVMLGTLLHELEILSLGEASRLLEEVFPKHRAVLLPLNRRALEAGWAAAVSAVAQ